MKDQLGGHGTAYLKVVTLESKGDKSRCQSRMLKPWIWSDMCRERQRLRKVFKKTFKTTVFRSICRVFQQQVTHALLMLATRGQPHTAIQGQALQDEGGEFPGLQKKPESSEF